MQSPNARFYCFCLVGVISVFLCVGFSDQRTPATKMNSRTFFQRLITGRGLYNDSDHITVLNRSNFEDLVLCDETKAWYVEFYLSWCGQCQNFAPIWREFALGVRNWRDYVAIGVMDCSDQSGNGVLCSNYSSQYPTIKFFPPNSDPSFLGEEVPKGLNVDENRHHLIKTLKTSQGKNQGTPKWPIIKVTENLTDALATLPSGVQHVGILFDRKNKRHNESFFGEELIIDFHDPKYKIKMFKLLENNTEYVEIFGVKEFPSLYVQKLGNKKFEKLTVANNTREDFYNATKDYLRKHDISVPDLPYYDGPKVVISANNTAFTGILVFQLDIEQGIRETLLYQISHKQEFKDETLEALKRFVRVVSRYAPLPPAGKELLEQVAQAIWDHEGTMTKAQYEEYLEPFESKIPEIFMNPPGYMNCHTSSGKQPCSIWLLFHTLTVHAESNHTRYDDEDAQDVLRSIAGFVKYFFLCKDCSDHFGEMAVSIPDEVKSFDDSILWLWRGHNKVNARLVNDATGGRHKVQYPTYEQCKPCYEEGDDGQDKFIEEEVLKFVKQQYGHPSRRGLNNTKPTRDDETESMEEEPSRAMKDLVAHEEVYHEEIIVSSFVAANDLDLCIGLYLIAATILMLIGVKCLLRKNQRQELGPS